MFLTDHLYPIIKHGSDFVQDDDVPLHRAREVSEWFDEAEKDIN